MKKNILLICLAFLIQANAAAQSCLSEGITFYSQEEIDNFPTNYPGCTEIEGYVQLYGYGTFNLDSLSVLSSIGGWFAIEGLPNLTNLNGLNNLTSIGGGLYIGDNDSLTSITALENLTSVNNELTIASNPLLTTLNGLESLVSIGSNYYGESLTIYDNDVLNSLSGIENINADSIVNLTILSNPLLSYCEIENICEYLLSPNGSVVIAYNGENCNSPVAIAAACGNSLACLPYGDYIFTNQAEIDSFSVNFPDCTDLEGFLSIQGEDIINLNGLSQITSISENLDIYSNPLLTSLNGLDNLISIGSGGPWVDGLYIRYNESLINLTGLNNLISIDGNFQIQYNDELQDLSGLENLSNITQAFEISSNPSFNNFLGLENLSSIGSGDASDGLFIYSNESLTDLIGLDNLISINNQLKVYNNSELSNCTVESVCEYLIAPNANVFIENNAVGCSNQLEVEDACIGVSVEEQAKELHITIYPNPADNELLIKNEANIELEELIIYNQMGQEVMYLNKVESRIDISSLQSGVYLIEIRSSDLNRKEIFIKN